MSKSLLMSFAKDVCAINLKIARADMLLCWLAVLKDSIIVALKTIQCFDCCFILRNPVYLYCQPSKLYSMMPF